MRASDFDFDLPEDLIAQVPAPQRDQSRLMVLERDWRRQTDALFSDLPQWLKAGDLLVLNNSRVIPARLRGCKAGSGGRFEILLLRENAPNDWWVMLRPAHRIPLGTRLLFYDLHGKRAGLEGRIIEKNAEGYRRIAFEGVENIKLILNYVGEVPLPPYITRKPQTDGVDDAERYQTIYAESPGSVAAPTAGLHFTPRTFEELERRGIERASITLHVGPGTFAPVKSEDLQDHVMHEEYFELGEAAVEAIIRTRRRGGRVVAVGTTCVRVLESVAARFGGELQPVQGATRLFIHPPYSFKMVDGMLTNFHLPKSTLLMLVCAFASPGSTEGVSWIISAYQEAIRRRFRFFSYGDAMLLI